MTDDLATDYERAGFGGRLPFGRRPALLLIDIVMAYLGSQCQVLPCERFCKVCVPA